MIIETSVLKNIRVSVCRPQQSTTTARPQREPGDHCSPTARTGRPPLAHSESRATTAYPQRDPGDHRSPTMRAGRPPVAHDESGDHLSPTMYVGWSLVAHLRTGLVSGPAHFESADSNVVWAYTLCAKLWPNISPPVSVCCLSH